MAEQVTFEDQIKRVFECQEERVPLFGNLQMNVRPCRVNVETVVKSAYAFAKNTSSNMMFNLGDAQLTDGSLDEKRLPTDWHSFLATNFGSGLFYIAVMNAETASDWARSSTIEMQAVSYRSVNSIREAFDMLSNETKFWFGCKCVLAALANFCKDGGTKTCYAKPIGNDDAALFLSTHVVVSSVRTLASYQHPLTFLRAELERKKLLRHHA
jgi:hypothetical protein